MGNLISCCNGKDKDNLLGLQCPYCKLFFKNEKEKKKHMKICFFNKDITSEMSIYCDHYKL